MNDLTIILRSLRTRLVSTIITIATVATAVSILLVLLSLRASAMRAFDRGTGNVHLLVSRDASPLVSVLNGLFYAAPPAKPLMYSEYERLVSSAPLEWAVPVQLGDSYKGQWPVLATTPEFFTRFRPAEDATWKFGAGNAFAADFQVVVGASAARATGLKVGDHIHLTHGTGLAGVHVHAGYEYVVVGVLAPTGTAHDRGLFTSLQSAWIVHASDRHEREEHDEHGGADAHHEEHDHEHEEVLTAADLTDEDRKLTNVFVRVATRPGSDVSASIPVVMEMWRREPAFAAAPLTVAGPQAEIRRLRGIVGNVDQILLAMAGAVMLSSAVGILLALYNSMEQRRRQIAILRVLGASPGRIFGLIITESAALGLAGALGGALLAIGGGVIASQALKERLGLVIPATPDPGAVLGVTVAALILACAAGILPGVVAYRTSVAGSLRPTA